MSVSRVVRRARRQVPWAMVALVVGALVLMPIIPLQFEALKDGAQGFSQLGSYPRLGEVAYNTVALGVGAMVFALILGTALAVSVQALKPGVRRFAMVLPVLPLLIPGTAHVTGFVFLFSPEVGFVNTFLRATPLFDHLQSGPLNIYSFGWIVAYTGFHLASLVYLFVYNGLEQLGASALAPARVSGAGTIRAFFTVTLPMLRPVLLYSSTIVLLLALGQFTGPLFLGRRENLLVVTTEMFRFTQAEPIQFGLGAALGAPLLVLSVVLIAMQRRLLQRQERYAMTQSRAGMERTFSRRTQMVAGFSVISFAGVSAVLPVLALGVVATSRFWSGRITMDNFTFDNVEKVFGDPLVTEAIVTTVRVSIIAAVIVTALGFLASFALFQRDRYSRVVSGALDIGATATLAVPAAMLGFGFLFAYRHLGWYGSEWGLVLAFVTVGLPFSVRYQLAGMVAVGQLPIEASMTSGAGMLRCTFQVLGPLIRRSMAASAAIVLVLLTHEFGTSVMLRSPDTTVMSVRLFDFFTGGLYPQVAAMGLVMAAVTAVVVILALLTGATRGRTL